MWSTRLSAAVAAAALSFAPVSLADSIVARGSDSTAKVMTALAKAFEAESGHTVTVEGGGSSKGAADCLKGEVDVAILSRALKSKETDAGLVGQQYAIDAVAVVVNAKNPAVDLSKDDLAKIFAGETSQWPDGKPVLAMNRPEDSGTRECFQKVVLGKEKKFSPKCKIRHNAAGMATASKAPTAIFYTSAGGLKGDEAGIKVLTVNGVEPTPANIRSETYPITRKLTIATKGEAQGAAKEFIAFIMSNKGQSVVQVTGFTPVGEDAIAVVE